MLRAGEAARGGSAAGITGRVGGAMGRGAGDAVRCSCDVAPLAGGVRPGARVGKPWAVRESSASEDGTRLGPRDPPGLGAVDDVSTSIDKPREIELTRCSVGVAKADDLEWNGAVGDGAEKANERREELDLLSGVI
jgi:hypothetical protein